MEKEKKLYEIIYQNLASVMEQDINKIKNIPSYSELEPYGLDSITFIKFIVSIEEALGIEISDEDLIANLFNTIDKIYEKIYAYTNSVLKDYKTSDAQVQNIKCLVVDCDNCLWGGIANEDKYIQLGDDYPGSLYKRFQEALVKACRQGILICLCSKNEETAVMNIVGNHPDMLLRSEHIVSHRINWKEKFINIFELANELNIGRDTILFIDDDEREIDLMNQKLPEIYTKRFDLKKINDLIAYINRLPGSNLSTESANRTRQYKQEKQRESNKKDFHNIDEYYRSLETVLTFSLAEPYMFTRLSELSRRTNQFNLTSSYYTTDDLAFYYDSDEYSLITLQAKDRFGDMQTIAFAVMHYINDTASIEGFMLSCRVFSRKFENMMIHQIIDLAKNNGCKALIGLYKATEKNKRFANFYMDHSFQETTDGYIFNLVDSTDTVALPNYFKEIRWIPCTTNR